MAIRNKFWNEDPSIRVVSEKQFLRDFLTQHQIFENTSLEDVKYFFYCLPSIIIVKAYGLGFLHESVITLMQQFVQQHHEQLSSRADFQIKFNL